MSPAPAPRRTSVLQTPAFLQLMSHVATTPSSRDRALERGLRDLLSLLNTLQGVHLQVTVRDGVAIVSGTVVHAFHKALAVASVASVIQGRTVRDQVLTAAA